MMTSVVEVDGLTRRFGDTLALDDVDLRIHPGRVYGLVGANGAGKTTLIRHLLGLLRAERGAVRVFGYDPVQHPVEVLQRIGYLSEERDLPEWMRIDELLRFTRAFHPNWDCGYANELLTTFRLDPRKRVKNLSKGMRAQAGLIAAVVHRPELLLLDEPSTGLDAVVRRDILNAIVRTVADDGRTVLFSSHLLDEVEQMSDYVVMVDAGRFVLQGDLEEIRERHQRIVVRFAEPITDFPPFDELLSAERKGRDWTLLCAGTTAEIQSWLGQLECEVVQLRQASLQEIFLARVGRGQPVQAEV